MIVSDNILGGRCGVVYLFCLVLTMCDLLSGGGYAQSLDSSEPCILSATVLTIQDSSDTRTTDVDSLSCGGSVAHFLDDSETSSTVLDSADSYSRVSSRQPFSIKTNIATYGLLVANAAVEVGLSSHLSFHLPVYYSSWDWFTAGTKFRTLAFQPELRYNFRPTGGFFIGAHFTAAWFNLALGGDYRYQDRNGDTPALGGGISAGYRLPLGHHGRWGMELAIGAGACKVHYDRFYNEPNGAFAGRHSRTYIGVDNASISFTYSLGRRGRR